MKTHTLQSVLWLVIAGLMLSCSSEKAHAASKTGNPAAELAQFGFYVYKEPTDIGDFTVTSLSGETVQSATDYPFTFTVTDKVGLTSVYRGYIPVDILVIRDGDKLKIAVPSIIFRANAADFEGLDKAIVDKNKSILKRIAVILNKFPEYQVQVEGHANTTTGTEKEETTALLPLSKQRAEAVRQFLIKEGLKSSRLSSIGMGSSKPVASLNDRDNWWKNRRVEFILIKQ